jgi:hypothetical protein
VPAPSPVAPAPPPVVTPPPKPPAPPPEPPREPSGEGWSNALIAVIVVTVLLIGGGIAAAVILSRDSDPEPAAKTTPEAQDTPQAEDTPDPAAALKRQVVSLDRLLKRSAQGRAAAVEGDFAAAIENREGLLRSLRRLRRQADDGELKSALTTFNTAIREALRQNKECEAACSTQALERVGKLKEDALAKINPLLEAQGLDTYETSDI